MPHSQGPHTGLRQRTSTEFYDVVLMWVQNGAEGGYPIGKGCDLFISVWNLHRSPHLWKDPDAFRPERFSEPHSNPAFNGKWAGYR